MIHILLVMQVRTVDVSSLFPSSPTPATTNEVQIMLAGMINSASVSVVVYPETPTSTIALSATYRLISSSPFSTVSASTLATFRFPFQPAVAGFYTSRLSLRCSHTTESNVILVSDWMSSCGVALSDDVSELADRLQTTILFATIFLIIREYSAAYDFSDTSHVISRSVSNIASRYYLRL